MTIGEMLERARRGLRRLEPHAAAEAVREGALLVDIRPEAQRRSEGAIPGAVVIERNVLEWRLDPASPWRIAEAGDPDRHVIVVCSEGYSSSLAAASLQELGLWRATDLVGGFQAWAAAGLPASPAGPRDGARPARGPAAASEPDGASGPAAGAPGGDLLGAGGSHAEDNA